MENKRKTWVFADVHGAYKALKQIFERAPIQKGDRIISLGDIADGWSQVPECVELLQGMRDDYEMIFLRGNHDVWAWNWFNYGDQPLSWTRQGGSATIAAYINQGSMMDFLHKDFWDKQIDYFIDEENRLFVHAGFELDIGFQKSKNSKVNIRNATELHWTRDLADFNVKSCGKQAIAYLDEFKEIFIGHTAHNDNHFNPKGKHNVWNLDTGAGWNGKLTIMDVETKEFWQSDPTPLLYPNESGRR